MPKYKSNGKIPVTMLDLKKKTIELVWVSHVPINGVHLNLASWMLFYFGTILWFRTCSGYILTSG